MDPPRFDWYSIPGATNGQGTQSQGTRPLNTMFDRLQISNGDRAFHSEESLPVQQPDGVHQTLSSTEVNERPEISELLKKSFYNRRETVSGGSPSAAQKRANGNGNGRISSAPTGFKEGDSNADDAVPLSLTADQLTRDEAKAYLRWYDYIESRKKGIRKTVSIDDVFHFLGNFGIDTETKQELRVMFARWSSAMSIGQFFALMRVLAHALQNDVMHRTNIRKPCQVPRPISIMSRKRGSDEDDETENPDVADLGMSQAEGGKLDLDSFTQFILTGQRPASPEKVETKRKKSNKKVKFCDEVVYEPAPKFEPQHEEGDPEYDMQLPMEVLLARMEEEAKMKASEEAEAEPDEPGLEENKFKYATIDKAVPSIVVNDNEEEEDVPIPPALEPLAANMTGSATKMRKEQDEFNAGSERATMFLESALTGGQNESNVRTKRSPPPPPPRNRASSNSHRPPAPPPRKAASPSPLEVPQQIARPPSPSLPPKPLNYNQATPSFSQFNMGQGQVGQTQVGQGQIGQSQIGQTQIGQNQLGQGQSQFGQNQFGQNQFGQPSQFGQFQFEQNQMAQQQLNQPQLNQFNNQIQPNQTVQAQSGQYFMPNNQQNFFYQR